MPRRCGGASADVALVSGDSEAALSGAEGDGRGPGGGGRLHHLGFSAFPVIDVVEWKFLRLDWSCPFRLFGFFYCRGQIAVMGYEPAIDIDY